jgi:hypothetical protein
MNLEDMMLCEINESQMDDYYMISLVFKFVQTVSRTVIAVLRGGEMGVQLLMSSEF